MARITWKDYFAFSKKERISVYILLAILTLSIAFPYLYAKKFQQPVVDETLQVHLNAALSQGGQQGTPVHNLDAGFESAANGNLSPAALFYFDPNVLDAAGFKKLGLRDKTIQTIINYRSKGGYFRQAEDIRKIYGLRADEADRLIPYITIKSTRDMPGQQREMATAKPAPAVAKIDINTATEEEWKALPGIGDVLSRRIVKFRNSIHGFSSVQDVGRTYGLSDSVFQALLPYLTLGEADK